jgi:hypothetical protein
LTTDIAHFGDAAATSFLLEKLIEADKNNLLKEMLDDDGTKIYLPKNLNKKHYKFCLKKLVCFTFTIKTAMFYLLIKAKIYVNIFFIIFLKKQATKQKATTTRSDLRYFIYAYRK